MGLSRICLAEHIKGFPEIIVIRERNASQISRFFAVKPNEKKRGQTISDYILSVVEENNESSSN